MARRRPRAIGTAAESAVVQWLRDNGWPDAERLPLHGNRDHGDVRICQHPFAVIAECKAGAAAETASAALIGQWLEQTETERRNAGADLGVLVVRRFRRPVAAWDVHMRLRDAVWLDLGPDWTDTVTPVRMALADFTGLLLSSVGQEREQS